MRADESKLASGRFARLRSYGVYSARLARGSLTAVADLLIPRGCAACDTPLYAADGAFCTQCALRIGQDAGRDYCPRCGTTAEPYLVTADGCPLCRRHRSPIVSLARAGTYGGEVGTLIKRFKFGGRQRLDQVLGSLLADAMRVRIPFEELDALVPVPADWQGWWRYRFHPAGLIADCVGRNLAVPVAPIIRAARLRRRQIELPASERAQNICGAFRPARGIRVAGATVCVIDDVSTTGATLREMARVLKESGAARVFAAVVAKTQLGVDDHHRT